jgi:hypothetical protein
MSANAISTWLQSIDLGAYAQAFEQNHIGLDDLRDFTSEDLTALGIESLGHRKKLLAEISRLAASPSPPEAPSTVAPVTSATDTSVAVFTPAAAHSEVSPEKKHGFWARIFVRKFLFISVVVHLIFGIGAACFVVQKIQTKRKVTFQGGPPSTNPSKRALEHKVSMAQKKKTGGAPPQAKRIVSAGLAKVSLPDLPSVSSPTSVTGMTAGMGGAGFGTGVGFGSGIGGGMGGASGGGGGMTFFGFRGGAGLIGNFYDLKQEKDGKPTDMVAPPGEKNGWDGRDEPTNIKYDAALVRLVQNGMSESALTKYFRGPSALSTTQLYIPSISANDGPKAFNLGDKVQPKRWLAVYRGKVIPPESGRYRFVGFGDDVLIVRFDNRLMLDGSLFHPTKAGRRKTCQLEGMQGFEAPVGETFEVRAGIPYNMEVVIGERPGGEFKIFLLLEKVTEQNDSGVRKLPIFKVAPGPMPARGPGLPVVEADTSWSVWKTRSQQPMLGGI